MRAALRGHHRPPRPGGGRRGGHPVQGGRARRPGSASARARRGRRDGPDRSVRRRRARPRGGRDDRVAARQGRPRRACRGRRDSSTRPALSRGARALGPGLDGILVVAKPAGPTSHDVVALVRRLAATKRVGHGGTLDPFASGSCRSSSAARRASSSTTWRPQVVPGHGLLRGHVDDRRSRRRAEPSDGRPRARRRSRRPSPASPGRSPSGRRRTAPPRPVGAERIDRRAPRERMVTSRSARSTVSPARAIA